MNNILSSIKMIKIISISVIAITVVIIGFFLILFINSADVNASDDIEVKANTSSGYEEKDKVTVVASDSKLQSFEDEKAVVKQTKMWAHNKNIKKKDKKRWRKIKAMSLSELEQNDHIEKLCKKYNMSKTWFDRIATTESGYGKKIPYGSYNAWGWGIYGNKITKMGNNWYDASEQFIISFVQRYGSSPSYKSMKRYCPSGAYDKYF